MTEQNKTPLTAQPGSAPAPEQKPAEKRPAEKPLRRVGSLTLGACLIAAGAFFLLYFFVPGFDVQLTLKIAPAVALVLLGCEVLFFAARPGARSTPGRSGRRPRSGSRWLPAWSRSQ